MENTLIDGEAGAAAAGGGGVGVLDGEMAAHEFVGIVELGAGQQVKAGGIDDDSGFAGLDDEVVGLCGLVEFEAVLEPAAAAREDGDSERALALCASSGYHAYSWLKWLLTSFRNSFQANIDNFRLKCFDDFLHHWITACLLLRNFQ